MEEIESLVEDRATPCHPSPPSKRQDGTATSSLPNSIQGYLIEAFQEFKQLSKGRPNSSLLRKPEDDVNALTISVVTTDGQTYQIGDTRQEFPLLALAKPFIFGLALEDRGIHQVAQKIGLEPTGTAFDQLLGHEDLAGRRFNPMVNLGAVATTSMIRGQTTKERRIRTLRKLSAYLGRPAEVDAETFSYRRRNDTRCRALTYFMAAEKLLTASVEDTLELYHTQSSVRISCLDAATMAGTLAHHGTNPMTGERAIEAEHVKRLLSVMFTSGLYESSGQWAYRNGIPAITSLAGAIMAVVPGRMGIAVYSPRLDSTQQSVRGAAILSRLAKIFRAHLYDTETSKQHHAPALAKPHSTRRTPRLSTILGKLHNEFTPIREGKSYEVTPDLRDPEPDRFGICTVSVEGQVHGVGDWQSPFLLQSISKVLVYGMALEDRGRDSVLNHVDVEPTGDPFNAIIKLERSSKRPYNPMVNTGGIATSSLIRGKDRSTRLTRILSKYARYVGRPLTVDVPTLLAEQSNGDRNRAIAHLLRHFDMIKGSVEDALDLYLQQCSVTITARDLAIIAGTLASGGINPITGERAIAEEYVKDLLTVMHTCGMYDYAGRWAYRIGLPAKSGVGGGIMAIVPGKMGIAVFSPRLDERGNSVRGIKTFEALSSRLGLHVFEPGEI